jgi:hypothetical protein
MPRSGFIRYRDKDAKGIQGIKTKNILRVRNPSSHPLLAFEDSNGVSPAHSPTRWELIKGLEEDLDVYESPPILVAQQDEKGLHADERSHSKPLKPIPIPQADQAKKTARKYQYCAHSTENSEWTSFSEGIAGRPSYNVETKGGKNADKLANKNLQKKEKSSKAQAKYPMDNESMISGSSSETSNALEITQMVSAVSSDESSCPPLDAHFAEDTQRSLARKDKGILYHCPLSVEGSQSSETEATTISGTSTSSKSSGTNSYNFANDDPEKRRAGRKQLLTVRREALKESKPVGEKTQRHSLVTRAHDVQSVSSNDAVKRRQYMVAKAAKVRQPQTYTTGPGRSEEKDESSYDRAAESKNPMKISTAMTGDDPPATRRQRTFKQTNESGERPAKLITKVEEPEYRRENAECTFDDAGIWKEVLSPSGDTNIWTTPRELLSPALFTKTPMHAPPQEAKFQSSSASVADLLAAAESAIEGPSKPNNSQDEFLKKFLEMALPMIKSGSISHDQQEEIRRAADKLGLSLDGDRRADEVAQEPTKEVPFNVEVVHRRQSFHDVKKKIGKRESIHFKKVFGRRRAVSPSSNSLLDSVGESDSQIDLKEGSSHDSEIKSTSSETVSTLSYHTKRRDASRANERKSRQSKHQSRPIAESKGDVENRPLGSTTEEINMLNKFLQIAGPSLTGPNLSAEDRERLHDDALKAGLPEDCINKFLDQSAGIQRWEESTVMSHRSKHRKAKAKATSPSGSLHTKSTDCSEMSQSTKYTRDNESVSCYTYDDDGLAKKSPKTEVGGYGCVDRIQSYFWMESDVVGQDMRDNVIAVISGDMGSAYCEDPATSKKKKRWLT